jgi:DNA ligase-4
MRKTNRRSQDEKFSLLIDESLRHYLTGYSWFPLLRLMIPDVDTTRPHTGMKEKNIAQAWGEGFDLAPGTRPFERLLNFNDPTHFGRTGASDLSLAVHEVVEVREMSKGSNLTLKQINELLDELVELKGGTTKGNHDWREGDSSSKKKKAPSLKQRRKEWVKKLRDKGLSAIEHKWVVRILLQKMELGFGSKVLLSRWVPGGLALELYRMNNNLKSVCTTLSNPHWLERHEEAKKEQEQNHGKVYVF